MIYVDSLMHNGWKYGPNCHMFADSEQELVEFAVKIGMQAGWLQRTKFIHFDLTARRRLDAIKSGAVEITGEQLWTMRTKFYNPNYVRPKRRRA